MKGLHGGKDPTIAHAEDCECFVCKRRRAKRDATKTTTAAEKADDDDKPLVQPSTGDQPSEAAEQPQAIDWRDVADTW